MKKRNIVIFIWVSFLILYVINLLKNDGMWYGFVIFLYAYFWIGCMVTILMYVLQKKSWILATAPIRKKYTEEKIIKIDYVCKIVTGCFLLVALIVLRNNFYAVYKYTVDNRLEYIKGTVEDRSLGRSQKYRFLSQTVGLGSPPYTYYSYYFGSQVIHSGTTYEFAVLPGTDMIVGFRVISE